MPPSSRLTRMWLARGQPEKAAAARKGRARKSSTLKLRPGQDAEDRLASELRVQGLRVEQQYPFARPLNRRHTADLYLPDHQLVIEVDGGSHAARIASNPAAVAERHNLLHDLGLAHRHYTPAQCLDGMGKHLSTAARDVLRVLGVGP